MLWHMHQPHYEDAASGEFALPWVRLHSAKDYVDMVERVAEHPGLKLTFNVVPSFLEQLDGYAAGRQDAFQRLALQPAETLDAGARAFYFRHFLALHPNMGARRWTRYAELQAHLPPRWKDLPASELESLYSAQELRDIATLFHLGWLDERHWEPCGVAELARRGRNFTEEEKSRVLDTHLSVMARAPEAYRTARDSGQVELTCSPFYHPILPLLLDPRSAWEALPELPLPERWWHFPEDARRQVRDALSDMERRFGVRPAGMWPSEGSVSQATAALLAEEGVRWTASDEGVLARSLGLVPGHDRTVRGALYQPWRVHADGRHIDLFFRDQEISDRIGFAYQGMSVEDAVADFIGRLRHVGETWKGPHDPVVTVALDGENCWEGYEKDGDTFLRALYGALTGTPWLRTVTFSEVMEEFPDPPPLERLFAGSWIHQEFRIWIGHPEDNAAWERLLEAREAWEAARSRTGVDSSALDAAWRHLAAAEGSDWFWWYGDEHYSPDADIFDRLFRGRLSAVHRLLGEEPPDALRHPIKPVGAPARPWLEPLGILRPQLDGQVSHFYEWRLAGSLKPGATGGAMHAGRAVVKELFFGFGEDHGYVRVDWDRPAAELAEAGLEAAVEIWEPVRVRLWLPGMEPGTEGPLEVERWGEGSWRVEGSMGIAVTRAITEIAIPLADLSLSPGDPLVFSLRLLHRDGREEVIPSGDPIRLTIPEAHFEDTQWSAQ